MTLDKIYISVRIIMYNYIKILVCVCLRIMRFFMYGLSFGLHRLFCFAGGHRLSKVVERRNFVQALV